MAELQELTKESHLAFLNSTIECMKYFQKADEYIEKQTAESFTPFSYINFNENMSSTILKDFLDPKGLHGQGTLFLEDFLKAFCEDFLRAFCPDNFTSHLDKAILKTEVRTSTIEASARRIDILITFPDAILAIENKLWEKDQYEQVKDYLKHIKNECPSSSKENFHLLYLTPLGKDISEYSLSEKEREKFGSHYHPIEWEAVLEVLEESSHKAPPEKLRVFIKDFCKTVRYRLW